MSAPAIEQAQSGEGRLAPGYLKTAVFTVIVILSSVLGNLALSIGLKGGAAAGGGLSILKVFASPLVAAGVALLILWLVSRMALLSWADLSFVVPVTSIGYVLAALLGKFVLAEQVSGWRWAGALCIMAGSILVGLTPHRTHPRKET
jgi:drug/metabolite transporter (DMT)-like permease